MNRDEFREQLLGIMEQKTHWAWQGFTRGLVPKEKLHIHLEQEYATYVRDFPILIGRAYIQCPVPSARRELLENIYEEETGKLNAGKPHPELFLEYPKGLGMDLSGFENPTLLAGSATFRNTIDESTLRRGWSVGAAVTTIFLEGTPYERGELDANHPKRPAPPLSEHPLVVHYGLPLASLALTKAHRSVEGEHRKSAWTVVLDSVPVHERSLVIQSMNEILEAWHTYRDDVALACELQKDEHGRPQLRTR